MQLLNNFDITVFNRDEIEYNNSKAHVAHKRAKEQHKLFVPPRAHAPDQPDVWELYGAVEFVSCD